MTSGSVVDQVEAWVIGERAIRLFMSHITDIW